MGKKDASILAGIIAIWADSRITPKTRKTLRKHCDSMKLEDEDFDLINEAVEATATLTSEKISPDEIFDAFSGIITSAKKYGRAKRQRAKQNTEKSLCVDAARIQAK